MTKREAFYKACDMMEQFAKEQNICIVGTLVFDDPEEDCAIRQVEMNF